MDHQRIKESRRHDQYHREVCFSCCAIYCVMKMNDFLFKTYKRNKCVFGYCYYLPTNILHSRICTCERGFYFDDFITHVLCFCSALNK